MDYSMTDTTQRDVLRAQQAFWDALKAKDARQFDTILAEDFAAVRPDQSRADFIRSLTSFPVEITAVSAADVQVRRFGDVAVLTGTQVAHIRLPNGSTVTQSLALTNIFRHTADQWRMVLAHPVEVTEAQV
jgi:ketosteroid isomerase-like protein